MARAFDPDMPGRTATDEPQAAASGCVPFRPMLILLNKPFGVLCQFTDRRVPPRRTLAEFIGDSDVYPAGRLDYNSEGLLVLSDDGALRTG